MLAIFIEITEKGFKAILLLIYILFNWKTTRQYRKNNESQIVFNLNNTYTGILYM